MLEDIDKETSISGRITMTATGAGSPAHARAEPTDQRDRPHRRRHGDNVPPHNLTEIIEATVALIRNPALPLAKIMEMSRTRFPDRRLHPRNRAFWTRSPQGAAT